MSRSSMSQRDYLDSPVGDYRETDPWTKKISRYATELKSDAAHLSELHEKAGHHFSKLRKLWGVPPIVISAIWSPLVLLVAQATGDSCATIGISDYIATGGFILTNLFAGVNYFYQFGPQSQEHFAYSANYMDLVTDIDAEMIKGKQFRTPADVFITSMKMKYDQLIKSEPVIPDWIASSNSKPVSLTTHLP